MNKDEGIYLKFPCVLRKKMEEHVFDFPTQTEFEYEPIWGYRCIEREQDDNTVVGRNDFLSNIEDFIQKGKKIKKRRGQTTEPEDDINYYGVSLFKNKEKLVNIMHLPRPTKKICCGYVFMDGGPQATDDQHVNWWLYEDADVSRFTIEKGENDE
ncbi:MAG: hypothetical protein R3Y67_06790 [Eubacteriales bacterium]